jgi:predicted AAA+ superfamily ATPase
VLVKGSRGMGMESIVRSLREPAADSGLAHARGSAQEQR